MNRKLESCKSKNCKYEKFSVILMSTAKNQFIRPYINTYIRKPMYFLFFLTQDVIQGSKTGRL